MLLTILLITILAFNGYAILEGYREAFYWHYHVKAPVKDRYKIDIHPYFAAQRIAVYLFAGFVFYFGINDILYSFLSLVAFWFEFHFLHNGMYYTFRNKLNSKTYPKRWFAQSTTSTAMLTKYMTPINRTILFVLGIIIHTLILYLNY